MDDYIKPDTLYKALDEAGACYDVIEIIEGLRIIAVLVTEPKKKEAKE